MVRLSKRARVIRGTGRLLATAVPAVAATTMAAPTGATAEQVSATRFTLTIDGYEIAAFQELVGMTLELQQSEYWESSGDDVSVTKLPGRVMPPSVTLGRGLTGSVELWSWHEAVRSGGMNAARRSTSLVAFSAEGRPVVKWWLEKAWPSKLEIGARPAGTAAVLTEKVTLTAESIQRVAP